MLSSQPEMGPIREALMNGLGNFTFDDVSFENLDLRQVDLSKSKVFSSRFENCDFMTKTFSGSIIRESHFIGCRFKGTAFVNASLEGCTFKDCSFNGFSSMPMPGTKREKLKFEKCWFQFSNVLKEFLSNEVMSLAEDCHNHELWQRF